MKKPEAAPDTSDFFVEAAPERLVAVLSALQSPAAHSKYLHWSKLKHLQPPAGLTHREWWAGLKMRRQQMYKRVPLRDQTGAPFQFAWLDPIPERLHEIDLRVGGTIQMPEQITNPETRDQFYVSSLIEEAITSSQLEGATTTRLVAKEMLRTGRPPHDKSEQMILNNYRTMQRIGKLKQEPLTKELVLELHGLVTQQTLDNPSAAGRFRLDTKPIVVGDDYGEVFYEPPPASQLEERMAAMCDFANGKTPDSFIHPAIRSIILHFWLAYDHPFVDGNGRTARALFYWSMLRYGFWLCEFISISHMIRKCPAKYGRAFLHTETDDNDLTYFILFHLEIIRRAVQELYGYIRRKTQELKTVEARLRGLDVLNYRQRALISHALRHPTNRYTIKGHRVSHNVVYQTARTDLLDLHKRGLFDARKHGKTWYFMPRGDLATRLEGLT
jgi:Fic family protein